MNGRSRLLKDLTDQTFGRLTVVSRADTYVLESGGIQSRWHCRCSCGETRDVRGSRLRSGETRSCGCIRRDRMREMNVDPQVRKRPAE
jgi:hypothetical protein